MCSKHCCSCSLFATIPSICGPKPMSLVPFDFVTLTLCIRTAMTNERKIRWNIVLVQTLDGSIVCCCSSPLNWDLRALTTKDLSRYFIFLFYFYFNLFIIILKILSSSLDMPVLWGNHSYLFCHSREFVRCGKLIWDSKWIESWFRSKNWPHAKDEKRSNLRMQW